MTNTVKPHISDISIVDELAGFVIELRLDDIPAQVVGEAKRCILDTVGVIIAGQQSSIAQACLQQAQQAYAPGLAHVIGSGSRLSPMAAALVNGSAAHANDFDDTSYTGIMHGSAVVLPAALAMAEQHDSNGKLLVEAFIVGVEVEYAIAEYCTTKNYFKGWWTSGIYGTLGAAAASAKILGLNLSETAHALAIAISNSSGMKAIFGSDAKPLGIGMAASKGIECAQLAQLGVSASNNMFESKNGFLNLIGEGYQNSNHPLSLGHRWRLIEPGILFKSYPVCSAAQAGAELALQLVTEHEIQVSDIESIDCEVPDLVLISLIYNQPNSVREAQFSMPFAIACTLTFGELTLKHLSDKTLADPRIQSLMSKVSIYEPVYLANDTSVADRCPEGAGIILLTKQGKRMSSFLERPTGMPGNPVSNESLIDKFIGCIKHAGFDDAYGQRLATEMLEIDKHEKLSPLFSR